MYYKILLRLKNGFRISAGNIPEDLRQSYKLNSWNKPKINGSGMFIFTNYSSAHYYFYNIRMDYKKCNYSSEACGIELWSVKCEGVKTIKNIITVWDPWLWAFKFSGKKGQKEFISLWKELRKNKFHIDDGYLPIFNHPMCDTKICDTLKLEKLIKNEIL